MHTHERLAVYVPDPDAPSRARLTVGEIDPGSGIVGAPVVPGDPESPVLVYFEGNRYNAGNMKRYADRVMHAAGRLSENAPTIAKTLAFPGALLHVGWYYPAEGRIDPVGEDDTPEPGRALYQLHAWLGLPLDGPASVNVGAKMRAELRCEPRPMSAAQARDYARRAARLGYRPTADDLADFEQAHHEGLHDEVPREFCPICESQGRRA